MKPETSGFCTLTSDIDMIMVKGAGTAEKGADPGNTYTTTIPSTKQGKKKSVDDIPLQELDSTLER